MKSYKSFAYGYECLVYDRFVELYSDDYAIHQEGKKWNAHVQAVFAGLIKLHKSEKKEYIDRCVDAVVEAFYADIQDTDWHEGYLR